MELVTLIITVLFNLVAESAACTEVALLNFSRFVRHDGNTE